jgi:hypothetical protein
MVAPMRWLSIIVLAMNPLACGPDPAPDVDGGSIDAAAGGEASCEPDGARHAVVLLINGATDAVEVRSLDGGQLGEPVLHDETIVNPRAVAIRADGREALIGWGGFGAPYGVARLELGEGGTSATLHPSLELGSDHTTFAVAYGTDDLALLATAGPDDGQLVALERGVDGEFVAGPISAVPDNWPLDAAIRNGREQILLARAEVGLDTETDLYLLARDGGGAWQPTGTPGAVAPVVLDVALHPGGDVAYAVAKDPDDTLSVDNLDIGGLLHAVPIGAGGLLPAAHVDIPGPGNRIAVDPGGDFLVVDSPIYTRDETSNTPIARERRLFTIPLSDGVASAPSPPSSSFPALLVDALELTARGALVMSRTLYDNQAPAAERHPVTVSIQVAPGDWQVCSTVFLPGSGELAVAP